MAPTHVIKLWHGMSLQLARAAVLPSMPTVLLPVDLDL
jgi:hypothetical protein